MRIEKSLVGVDLLIGSVKTNDLCLLWFMVLFDRCDGWFVC